MQAEAGQVKVDQVSGANALLDMVTAAGEGAARKVRARLVGGVGGGGAGAGGPRGGSASLRDWVLACGVCVTSPQGRASRQAAMLAEGRQAQSARRHQGSFQGLGCLGLP